MNQLVKSKIQSIVVFIIMCLVALIVLIPIYYLIVTTFKTSTEAALFPMSLPENFNFQPYYDAFIKMEYPRAFKNTFLITFFSVVGVVICSSMGGYVLNRMEHLKLIQFIFIIILSGIMFPYQMSVLGLFKLIQGLHLMDTLSAVVFINIAVNIPFATFLFKSFVSTIPIELEEAARMDGAGLFRIFWTITFPLMKPVVATVAILNTLTIWNDFMGPLYFIQSREKNVILQEVYRNVGQFSVDWTSMFPMMVLAVLPLLLFYLFMQKYIIGGVMNGSIKG
ncbi:carbohydrate ABC transporter permease [Metabacillus sp. Hm71]|uniref:carbohydrate ABC transporter permease n=1 Tax=Metabacillus sp. Hm71 TaxID=3450743 RepID=UPI003F4371D6